MYVDGALYSSKQGDYQANTANPFYIGRGGNGAQSPNYFFDGAIDEVRMYDSALSAAEIEGVYRETHPCDSFIDHFEINTLNAQGITCEADDIIIKACADASCSTVNPDAVDVKLFINNVENKIVTVSGNNGTSTSYSYTTVGNAALSLDQDYECKDSNNKPCIVNFKDSGFIISDIPMQISREAL